MVGEALGDILGEALGKLLLYDKDGLVVGPRVGSELGVRLRLRVIFPNDGLDVISGGSREGATDGFLDSWPVGVGADGFICSAASIAAVPASFSMMKDGDFDGTSC
jgi:hypothetical protein